jgi:hypothetical protein
MKRRGLRATLTAGVIGLAVLAVVVAFNWGIVRDHAEAWWFVWTEDTETAIPDADGGNSQEPFSLLADAGDRPAIFRVDAQREWVFVSELRAPHEPLRWDTMRDPSRRLRSLRAPGMLVELRRLGYRIIEQRFPRRAYVVTGYPTRPGLSEGTLLPPKLLPEPSTTRELKTGPR